MALKLNTIALQFLIILLLCFSTFNGFSQKSSIENSKLKFGFNYGSGNQENFLFKSANYHYESIFYKLQINICLKRKKKWEFALNIEPSFYKNQFSPYSLVLDTKKEKESNKIEEMEEFGINFGIQTKFKLTKNLYTYFLGSVGPTFFNTKTERLSSGMSFSDILALGINYYTKLTQLDLRLSFRHVSNAGLNQPNRGYNSLNFEVGLTVPLVL